MVKEKSKSELEKALDKMREISKKKQQNPKGKGGETK